MFLAVPEKTRIIGAVTDVLPEELNPRLLPGFACHEVRPYKTTVEVASPSIPGNNDSPRKGPIAQRLEQGTHNPIRTFPSFAAVCVSSLTSGKNNKSFLPILRSFAVEIAHEYRKEV